jgi:hypothetical protein
MFFLDNCYPGDVLGIFGSAVHESARGVEILIIFGTVKHQPAETKAGMNAPLKNPVMFAITE